MNFQAGAFQVDAFQQPNCIPSFQPIAFQRTAFQESCDQEIQESVVFNGGGGFIRKRKKQKPRDREEEVRLERIRLGILPQDPVVIPRAQAYTAPETATQLSEIDAEIAALIAIAIKKEELSSEITSQIKAERSEAEEIKRLRRNRAIILFLLAE